MFDVIDPKQFLSDELMRRCKQNPKYSMRSFARALEMTPAGLSLVLSGKRKLSRKKAERVVGILALSPAVGAAFLKGAVGHLNFIPQALGETGTQERMSLDKFSMISDWYHFGILSLIETKDFEPRLSWIASRLGISLAEAKDAVERSLPHFVG